MREYHIHYLDKDGRVFRAEALRCKDDLDALDGADRNSSAHMVEILEGGRLVARL